MLEMPFTGCKFQTLSKLMPFYITIVGLAQQWIEKLTWHSNGCRAHISSCELGALDRRAQRDLSILPKSPRNAVVENRTTSTSWNCQA
jgi:hypothetical protein